MDYATAREVLADKVSFCNYCKRQVKSNEELYDEVVEDEKTNSPKLKKEMLEWNKDCDQCSDQIKKVVQQLFRVKLNKLANVQWRIKYFDKVRKFYAHIHNFDIDKAVPYFDKFKELSHEGIEIQERMCDVDTEYGVYVNIKGTQIHYDKQHAYKEFCDSMMEQIKLAEDNMSHCKNFIVAMEVIKAKRNMITRKKKGKR